MSWCSGLMPDAQSSTQFSPYSIVVLRLSSSLQILPLLNMRSESYLLRTLIRFTIVLTGGQAPCQTYNLRYSLRPITYNCLRLEPTADQQVPFDLRHSKSYKALRLFDLVWSFQDCFWVLLGKVHQDWFWGCPHLQFFLQTIVSDPNLLWIELDCFTYRVCNSLPNLGTHLASTCWSGSTRQEAFHTYHYIQHASHTSKDDLLLLEGIQSGLRKLGALDLAMIPFRGKLIVKMAPLRFHEAPLRFHEAPLRFHETPLVMRTHDQFRAPQRMAA